ncbi:bifunctional oligoribonuclease/PAP phosphatase NrnA [Heliorestis acidaminivorans]|uniref:Bifunctional oligoribonuclease/PAP phosphatase NrnA n=1 Tax=Heliorestis acidaminivorans TaxID=553427 RepID=A0A6I0F3M0_9FIRM|nr:bifunctional oligoribonuclease/PAP phosphatase NrnA [Heliorestis acidaminivorans]KAB2954350.1 bifunctional oligoribonuclease/PAP phosphatase NrnA [Heliorestis acidaminivorans]
MNKSNSLATEVGPEIVKTLRQAKRVLLCVHQIPDGDALGSMSALISTLQEQGKDLFAYCHDEVPQIYRFLPGIQKVKQKIVDPAASFDVALIMDCGDLERIGPSLDFLHNVEVIINLDHHTGNPLFGHLNWVDTEAAATGEIVYQLHEQAGWPITADVATALYTSLMSDTGSFQFSNTSAYTMRIAAELREKGARTDEIRREIYEKKTMRSLQLLRHALNQLQISEDGQIAWISISSEINGQIGATHEDYEGIISYPRTIEGVEVALLFREMEVGTIKIGLRSNRTIDVAAVARQIGGGGHRRAAGCTFKGSLAEAEERLLEMIKGCLNAN